MLLWLDGQAHYDTAGIPLKYTSVDSTAAIWTVALDGRFGNCIKRVSTANLTDSGYLAIAPLTTRLAPWTPTTGGVLGFAIKIDALDLINEGSGIGCSHILRIDEGSIYHVYVSLNADGTFSLKRNDGTVDGPLLAQSIEGLSAAAWMYVEFKWLIHASAGTFEIRVNGVTVLTYAGNTRETDPVGSSLGVWNAVRLLRFVSDVGSPWLTARLCDLYLADLTSVTADDVSDFLGDGIIETILPNDVGASTGWTPSTAPNWDMVNDSPAPDGDTTTIETTLPGTIDSYHFEDIPSVALVKGAQVCILARKLDEGSAAIAPVVHQGGVDYVGPTQGVTSITFDRYTTQAYDLNPATLAKFTAAEVNAGQFGVKKVV